MKQIDLFSDSHLERLINGLGVDPSTALKQRAEALAREFDSATRRRGWKLAIALAAILIGIAIFISPKAYAVVMLRRSGQALDAVTSATVTFRNRASGNIVLRYFYSNGLWRFERPGQEVSIYRQGRMWTYRPDLNIVSNRPQDGAFTKGFSGFKLSDLLDEMSGNLPSVHIEKGAAVNGRDTLKVSVLNAPVQERLILTIDKESDLPISLEAQKPKNGTWLTMETADFEYNRSLDASLFQPNFPKTAIDEDLAKAHMARDLDKVVVKIDDGRPNPIVIRQVDINSRGHLFIAFTGSMDLTGRHMWITDDQGVEYLRGQLSSSVAGSNVATPLDLFINKKRVNAQWWIPCRPISHLPRTLTIRTTRGNEELETARVQIRVQAQAISTLPRYLVLLGGSPKDDLDLQLEEAEKQMGYAMSLSFSPDGKPAPLADNAGVACLVSGGPGFRHNSKDLDFALKQADKALDLCDQIAARDNGVSDSRKAQILFYKYEVLRYLGQTSEALSALNQAEQLDPETHYEKMKDYAF